MTAPDDLDATFEWLARCAAMGDGVASVHASRARAYIDRVATERDQALDGARRAEAAAADARRVVQELAVGVHDALNAADPARPGALARFCLAIDALPAIQEAQRLEQLGRAPIPSPRRRTP